MVWFDDILRSAGTCPTRESAAESSPCSEILRLGLTVQESRHGPRRWVTAAGWGNPDAALYLLGTTPKWHSPEVRGPNYANPDVDRGDHARELTLRLFPEFLLEPRTEIRPTTRWTLALINAWCGRDANLKRDVFVPEMLLCPQVRDPNPRVFRKAYQQCMERHFFRLVREASEPPTVVILGAGGTRMFYEVMGARGPVPSEAQVVVTRQPDKELSFPIVASLAPRGAMKVGLGRQDWVGTMLQARDQLDGTGTAVAIPSQRSEMDTEPQDRMNPETGHPVNEASVAASGILPFFPESLLGRRDGFGRRWSVMQAFAYGGTADDILQRAKRFDRRRAHELGKPLSNDIEGDRRYLRDESGFYPRELRKAGWTVLRWGERWVVEPPTAAAGGLDSR